MREPSQLRLTVGSNSRNIWDRLLLTLDFHSANLYSCITGTVGQWFAASTIWLSTDGDTEVYVLPFLPQMVYSQTILSTLMWR